MLTARWSYPGSTLTGLIFARSKYPSRVSIIPNNPHNRQITIANNSVRFKKIIPNNLPCESIVGFEFFQPVTRLLDSCRLHRNFPALLDELWLPSDTRRCLGVFQSKRDFPQDLAERHIQKSSQPLSLRASKASGSLHC